MAARKLNVEIEKTLKKVVEGVEVFEGIAAALDSDRISKRLLSLLDI